MHKTSLVCAIVCLAVTTSGCTQCWRQKCDGNNNCLEGCNAGFAGRKCIHQCQPNCINSLCYYDGTAGNYPCSIGCIHGFYGIQCNTPCQSKDKEGKCDRFSGTAPDCQGTHYGENCENSCEQTCNGWVCDNKGMCHERACKNGRYGRDCLDICETGCEVCHRDLGRCLKPYADIGNCSDTCKAPVADNSGYFITIIVLICVTYFGLSATIIYTWIKTKNSLFYRSLKRKQTELELEQPLSKSSKASFWRRQRSSSQKQRVRRSNSSSASILGQRSSSQKQGVRRSNSSGNVSFRSQKPLSTDGGEIDTAIAPRNLSGEAREVNRGNKESDAGSIKIECD